jgi:hypothetical protein
MLSQSRLNRSAACSPAWRELTSTISSITCVSSVGRGRSRRSPSSGLVLSRYVCSDGGCFAGDGGLTAFTSSDAARQPSLDAFVSNSQERRETCKQAEKKI